MTDPGTTRTRRGAHRARREILRLLVAPVLALAVVGAMIAGLVAWLGGSPANESDLAAVAPSVSATEQPSAHVDASVAVTSGPTVPAPRAPSSTAPSVVGLPTADPRPSAAVASASASASATATRSIAAEPVISAKSFRIVVLNQTGRAGLAAAVAGRLRAGGWQVTGVGNFRGSVAGTTVYYPPGARAAALKLARTLRGPDRVRPRFGNLSRSGLTVVLAGDYPG